MKIIKIIYLIFLLSGLPNTILYAQENELIQMVNDSLKKVIREEFRTASFKDRGINVDEQEVIKLMDRMPSFGIYKDTYFVTGVPLNRQINRNTADAVFQISIRQRLTKSILPFKSFLYLTYTQKAFWDIYSDSSPFRDNNYNPGIGIGKYIIENNNLRGGILIALEHESNGQGGVDSRSWNYISINGKYFINMLLSIGFKGWIPYVDGGENKDLLEYRGLGTISFNAITGNRKWWITIELTPRKGWGNINTTVSIGYKPSEKLNQSFFLRFSDGTGESLLHYNKYSMNLRLGICIKPDFYSFL
ncbi:MAG: phospholipase A [Prevotella sp.]|jgi:phospholipase A1|nr:phospholipase A [Prevotella sp.]